MIRAFFSTTELKTTLCPCGLHGSCYSPKMPVTGDGAERILVLAEAPGEREDERGIQLIGPAGQVLRKALATFGVDLDRDCRKTNAVRCRPPGNRRPTAQEIAACAPHVWEEIKARQPKVILLLGQVAVESFLQDRLKKVGAVGDWRGLCIPDQKARAWVCPTFHPSYILRLQQGRAIRGKAQSGQSVEECTFLMDIERALNCLNEPFPTAPQPQFVNFWSVNKDAELAIDYETTGLRPWARGHRIVSVGFSDGNWAAAVPMTADFARSWKRILQARVTGKVAHNMKFEHQWASRYLGVETVGWVWDTMLAAHLIDNRRHICGLKRQAYIHLGVDDWSGDVTAKFDEGGDGFNALSSSAPTPELLKYNALDAFYTHLLSQQQRRLFR